MNLPATIQGLQNLAGGESVARAGKVLPQVVTVGLVVLIAWQLARLTWIFLPQPVDAVSAFGGPLPPANLPAAAPKGANAQKIADTHLFGVANASDVTNVADAPQTQMTLVLAGIIASNDETKGFAFIGESALNAKLLRVGDTVGGVARLHSVYPDRVMLDRAGRLEALLLPRQNSSLMATRPPPVAMNPSPARFAENLRRIAETNPSAFSEIVRPQVVQDKGVMQGIRVYPGRNRQEFAKLGLQPGDLVKSINGTPLDDPQRSGEIFNTLSASDRAQITLERNGQTQQLILNTAQIALPDPTTTLPRDAGQPPEAGMPPQDMRGNEPRTPNADRVLVDPRGAEIQ